MTVTAGGKRQVRDLLPTGGTTAQDSLTIEFGLGAAATVEVLEVRWPNGLVERLESVPADRRLRIREGSGLKG